jgi:hypothetical protein
LKKPSDYHTYLLFIADSELTFKQIQNFSTLSSTHFDAFIFDNVGLVGHQPFTLNRAMTTGWMQWRKKILMDLAKFKNLVNDMQLKASAVPSAFSLTLK